MIGDLKLALRQLLKSPGYTALAVIALALGIGANTAIFSAIDALFLRPLRFADSGRLVRVATALNVPDRLVVPISYPRYLTVSASPRSFSGVGAWAFTGVTLTGRGEPSQINALRVTANLFNVLGVRPILGRGFLPEEDKEGGPAVVMLGQGYWKSVLGGDPGVIGRTLTLGGVPTTVVGVLPALDAPLGQTQMFLPRVFNLEGLPRELIDKGSGFLFAVGRLRDTATLAGANEDLKLISAQYRAASPDKVDAAGTLFSVPLQEDLVGNQRPMFLVLLATVGFVLIIACANVANLLLVRFTQRRREIAIRTALGATRGRIVRQFLVESLLTSLVAGALGLLIANWGVDLLAWTQANTGNPIPRLDSISLDGGVFAFALGVALLSGFALGLVPALQASRADAADALKEASRGSTAGRGVGRIRGMLLVTEVVLSLVLLAGAGLLLDSFRRLQRVDPGFDPERAAVIGVTLPDAAYPSAQRKAEFYRVVAERLAAIPGVSTAAGTNSVPLGGSLTLAPYAVEGRPVPAMNERPLATRPTITPGFFAAMGIPLKAGRDFTWRDTQQAPNVVIIDESMARRVFAGENPLGRRLITGILSVPREVVGVVGDVRSQSLKQAPADEMYYPTAQIGDTFFNLVVRTQRPARSLRGDISAAVHAVDPALPIADPQPLTDVVAQSIAAPQMAMGLLSGFAGLSLLLAGMGIYTVIAYAVTQRTAEIGIRMALGAEPRSVFVLVMRQGMSWAATGLVVGLAATIGLSRLMSDLLFEVSAYDPWILGGVSIFLAVVSALACAVPAWRAVRIDPIEALREG